MKIIIETIPSNQHRYETAGDYYWDPVESETLHVKVSEDLPPPYMWLLISHELHEALMCLHQGVGFNEIDDFDTAFEDQRKPGNEDEPGDDPRAPYHLQHRRAEILERLFAEFLNIRWDDYAEAFNKIAYPVTEPKVPLG